MVLSPSGVFTFDIRMILASQGELDSVPSFNF